MVKVLNEGSVMGWRRRDRNFCCRSGERGHKMCMDCGATSIEAGRKLQAEGGRLQPVGQVWEGAYLLRLS